MILTGKEIEKQVELGNIHIKPFKKDNINPNSYNYRLSNKLYKVTNDLLDIMKETQYIEIDIPEDGYILEPKSLYLGTTVESIGSDYFVTQLIGRSSVGRLGLFLQITAPLGHIGAKHCWTLELTAIQPIKIYKNMKIGQVSFWQPEGNIDKYTGSYNNYNNPHISEFFMK